MCGSKFRENHSREIGGDSAINPGLEEKVSALPIVRGDMMVTGFAEKKVGKREMTNGDYEEVTPHLIIGFFDI